MHAIFTGDEAVRNQLPAYEGSKSIQGVARSLVLVSHYLATGEVRQRAPFTSSIKVLIQPSRPGSFDTVFS